MLPKILCLGNELIKKDSFAKEVGKELTKEGYEIINVNDSFKLMEILDSSDDFIILDVAHGLKDVMVLKISELSNNSIISSHDFDSQFILKLFNDKNIRIIGIPIIGNTQNIKKKVKKFIEEF